MNLVEALQAKNDEHRRFVAELEETAKLLGKPNDPGLAMSKAITLGLIQTNEAAIASGDVVQLVAAARQNGIGA